MDTIYRERANGRWEYWMYCDGKRVYVPEHLAYRYKINGTARIVYVE